MLQYARVLLIVCLLYVSLAPLAPWTSLAKADDTLPPALRGWEAWVLKGEEYRRCPMLTAGASDRDGYLCAWPGRLRMLVDESGGRFNQGWQVFAAGWVPLPGSPEQWPERVRVNNNDVGVVERNGIPVLWLTPGTYTVSGELIWTRRPESVPIPEGTALVDLTLDGQTVLAPDRREGVLWLGARTSTNVPRQLDVRVFRKLTDDIPPKLTTRVQLTVGGEPREEVLGRALPEGFSPIEVTSSLAARIEPDGRLRVQLRAGEHRIVIRAHAADVTDRFELGRPGGVWPLEEVWSFEGNDRLRVASIEGARTVDPVLVGVPKEWQQLPSFRLSSDTVLSLIERSRGLSAEDGNRLTLDRDLWLDFDREGYLVADTIRGSMRQGWRLDMVPPYKLLNARQRNEDLLITEGDDGRTGVELRSPMVELETLSRIQRTSNLSAAGWDSGFERAEVTLHLPPGYRLLAAAGVDVSNEAWLEQWRVLDLFLIALIVAVVFRTVGIEAAACAAVALSLTYKEDFAPIWLWVNLVLAVVVARALPPGRLQRVAGVYQALAFIAIVLALAPFAVGQLRMSLHPQLDADKVMTPAEEQFMSDAAMEAPLPNVASPAASARSTLEKAAAAERRVRGQAQPQRYAPGTLLQTGPGKPAWSYKAYRLAWTGPIEPGQDLQLVVVTPFWLSLWRIMGLLASVALLLSLSRAAYGYPKDWGFPKGSVLPRAAGVLLVCCLAGGIKPAAAETPTPAMLAELKNRLTAPPPCVPDCAEVVLAEVNVARERMEVRLEIHALASMAVPVPSAAERWLPETVSIDGRADDILRRDATGTTSVPLTAGVHSVLLAGPIVGAGELNLAFPRPPRRIVVNASDWNANGLVAGRLLSNALQLSPQAPSAADDAAAKTFPTFVRVRRQLYLNLDWTVTTTVERVAPKDGAFTLRVPLLPGETVLTPNLEYRRGEVMVAVRDGEDAVSWTSSLRRDSLPRNDRIELEAPRDAPWVEQWDFQVSPIWHVNFAGTPAVAPAEEDAEQWSYQFLPRPGEKLSMTVTRPIGSQGATLAIDRVDVNTTVGARVSSTDLTLDYRSTQGGRHVIKLPPGARVESLLADGQSVFLRPQDGALPLELLPGSHRIEIRWKTDADVTTALRGPLIDLEVPSSNVRTHITLPEDRWVLAVFGAGLGPAVLYWGELAIFLAVALALGRTGQTPLGTRDWVLLGLGLSTFSWWVLLLFAAWLFVMQWRRGWTTRARTTFNFTQVALAALSVLALASLLSAIPTGLLGRPDMGIIGSGGSGTQLTWFVDRAEKALPQPTVISVSMWIYKLAMLAWALWLSVALTRWLPWAWRAYTANGLWRGKTVLDPGASMRS